jgi:nitrile hydratase
VRAVSVQDPTFHHHPDREQLNAARAKALESLLLESGVIDATTVDRVLDFFEHDMGPLNGAKVVARAWTDPQFKARLLADANSAIKELGLRDGAEGEHMVVVESTPDAHQVIICTLCSCYPWPLLGLPPYWYKDPTFRSRMAREPRTVLAELGTPVDEGAKIEVWDSSAQIRYMVLPERPVGTDGLSEEQLAALVTPEAMIGVERVPSPEA